MKENNKSLLKKLSWLLIKAFYPDQFTDLDLEKDLEVFYNFYLWEYLTKQCKLTLQNKMITHKNWLWEIYYKLRISRTKIHFII